MKLGPGEERGCMLIHRFSIVGTTERGEVIPLGGGSMMGPATENEHLSQVGLVHVRIGIRCGEY